VAAPYKARAVLDHSNTGNVGSNPATSIDLCSRFCVVATCAGPERPTNRSNSERLIPEEYSVKNTDVIS
jgi:hypothetical protein